MHDEDVQAVTGTAESMSLSGVISEMNGKLTQLSHLIDVLEARANTVPKSIADDEFPKVRDELATAIQVVLDDLGWALPNGITAVNEVLATGVKLSVFTDTPISPEILEKIQVWFEPGENTCYVIPGEIDKCLVAMARELSVPTFGACFADSKDMLYVPTILANTVGYYQTLATNGKTEEFDEDLNLFQDVSKANIQNIIGKFTDLQDAVKADAMVTIINACDDGANPEQTETAKKGMDAFVTMARNFLHNVTMFLNWVSDVNGAINDIFPCLNGSVATVARARQVYLDNMGPEF